MKPHANLVLWKFIFFLFIVTNSFASLNEIKIANNYHLDTKDSLFADTNHHSVKKASILSAVLPGAGQVYNHLAMPKGKKNAFWKIPIIYAGLTTTGYYLIQNNNLKRELKREFINRQKGNATLEKYYEYDSQGVLSLYEQHSSRRDLFIIGFSLFYILQIVDAAVEAHFVVFDISEDLSMKISPQLYSFNQVGLKLSFNLGK
jgi:hypothetical protein